MNPRARNSRGVTFILPFAYFGAAEDYAFILAEQLPSAGFSVNMLWNAKISAAVEARLAATSGVRGQALELEVLKRPIKLGAHLRRLGNELVHVNQVFLPGIAAASLSRRRIVVTAHNPALRPTYSRKGRLLASFAVRRVDAWIALSDRNRDLIAGQGVRPERINVVPNGLPIQRFDAQMEPSEARGALGLPSDAFVVGTVGRMSRQKRHDLLLLACSLATDSIPDLHVLFFGDGELREQTEEMAHRLLPGAVTFAGHRADAVRMLRAMDVFCLPSDYEGLSFALLEAMATGLSIVASDVQGSGEALVSGVSALIVPPGDAGAMADGLRLLHDDPALASQLASAAREEFYRSYTSDHMLRGTLLAYRQALG